MSWDETSLTRHAALSQTLNSQYPRSTSVKSVLRDLGSEDAFDAYKSLSFTNGATVRMMWTIVASPSPGASQVQRTTSELARDTR